MDYGTGALNWQVINRDEAARELIEHAIGVLDSGGSLVIALTLARSGGQFNSDMVRSKKDASALYVAHSAYSDLFGEATPDHKAFVEMVLGPSNALKHSNRGTEGSEVRISTLSVSMVVMLAIGDCLKATGRISEVMKKWHAEESARLSAYRFGAPPPEGFVERVEAVGEAHGRAWLSPDNDETKG